MCLSLRDRDTDYHCFSICLLEYICTVEEGKSVMQQEPQRLNSIVLLKKTLTEQILRYIKQYMITFSLEV